MKIDILKNRIFAGNHIISGVTKRNLENYPIHGFTISKSKIADDSQVIKYRNELANQLGIMTNLMKYQKQIHSDVISYVDEASENFVESDGMISDKIGIVLNISIADCAAVLLYDYHQRIICGVHSGWRGTSLNITRKCIEKMINEFSCNSEYILAYVSPCAGGDVYEVGPEFTDIFNNRSIKKTTDGKFLFDNRTEIYHQLIESGISPNNIELSDICTITNHDFHSFRRDAEKSGRMSAFIGMKA